VTYIRPLFIDALDLREPLYILLFRAVGTEHFSPVLSLEDSLAQYWHGPGTTLPLGFDRALTPLIPAMWFCLHLPRSRFDTIDIPCEGLKGLQRLHLPHRIAMLPISLSRADFHSLNDGSPKLVFAPNELFVEAQTIADYLDDVADVQPIENLTPQHLHRYWALLHDLLKIGRPQYVKPSRLLDLKSPLRAAMLPMHFVVRQLGGGMDEAVPNENEFSDQANLVDYFSHTQAVLSATAELELKDTPHVVAERIFPNDLAVHRREYRSPVALTVPGLSPQALTAQFAKLLGKKKYLNVADFEVENSVLDFLAAHRALASNGIALTSRPLSTKSFGLLDQLEKTWKSHRPRAVSRLLAQITQEVTAILAQQEVNALLHASPLTCFAEFPIGLAIFPGGTSPLCSRVPISYRPIVPLTRALQLELAPAPTIHWRGKLKVLVVEAISANEPVGRASRHGWALAQEYLADVPNTLCDVVEVRSIAEISRALERAKYDVLVLSAHGIRQGNQTGLAVGEDLLFGHEINELPPLVCLSACQVSPRGSGTVNVTDLMFRHGALAIIGTLIPVDVQRNALLMVRFFVNAAEALRGARPDGRVDTAWSWVQASNAVNDIVNSNAVFQKWAHNRTQGRSVIEEFMNSRSRDRLRLAHIYKDSEEVLIEIGRDLGDDRRVRAWLAGGYLPESLFYVMLGWPERLVFYDEDFAQAEDAYLRPQQ
jgi:hypothetical protein